MASTSQSPINEGRNPFLNSNSFIDEDLDYDQKYQNGLHAKARSLNDILSPEHPTISFSRTISMQQSSRNGQFATANNDSKENYSQIEEVLNGKQTGFSSRNDKVPSFFEPNGTKEQLSHSSSNIWSQGPNKSSHQTSIEKQRVQNRVKINGHEAYFRNGSSTNGSHKQSTRRNEEAPDNFSPSQEASVFSKVNIPSVRPMSSSKTHDDAITSQTYASDIGNAGLKMRPATSMSHDLSSVEWEARHSSALAGKFYSGKKFDKQCASTKTSEGNSVNDRQIVVMNASALSASPAATATDLSQHSASGVHLRDDSSKVYPHLIVSPYALDQRQRNTQDQIAKTSGREAFHLHSDKDEKKLSLENFKHSVWGGFAGPGLFSEHQQQAMPHQQSPYDSPFYPDVNSSGVSHPSARHYDVNPLVVVKEESSQGHHGNLPMTWDKPPNTFDRMIGSMYKPIRGQTYLKPPPVDLDDVSEPYHIL